MAFVVHDFSSDSLRLTEMSSRLRWRAAEWLDFYQKALKDGPLDDVLQMLNAMKSQIEENKKAGKKE